MVIDTREKFDKIIGILDSSSMLFFDIETTGLDVMREDYIVGIGMSTMESETYYFPLRHDDSINLPDDCKNRLSDLFRKERIFIGHNVKFDFKGIMHDLSVPFNYDWEIIDTQVMVRLISDEKFVLVGLKECIDRYFKYDGYKDIPKILMKQQKKKHMGQLPSEDIGKYCEEDVSWTRKLFIYCWKKILELDQTLIWRLEIETTKVLLNMEFTGVKFDREYCNKALKQLFFRKKEIEGVAYSQAGVEFNLGSTTQLNTVFDSMGIKPIVYTDKKKPKWDSASLMYLTFEGVKLAETMLDWRSLDKLESTYFSPLLDFEDNTIYCNFKNWRTATGRLSSTGPNLQNIPRNVERLVSDFSSEYSEDRIKFAKQWAQRGLETGRAKSRKQTWQINEEFDENNENQISARRLFVARDNYTLFAMDFSQMEIRVFLCYLNDPTILELLKDEEFDFHSFVAQEVYNCGKDHPDFKFFRQVSKEITYGIIYGMGNATLAFQMGTSVDEAKDFKKRYFGLIKSAEPFIEEVKADIEKGNLIYNMYKRRYYIPPERSYIGINYLVQGTSADLVKERMVAINKFLRGIRSHFLIQVHDEFIFELHNDEIGELKTIVNVLESNSLDIPIKLDVSICPESWANKIKLKDLDEARKYI